MGQAVEKEEGIVKQDNRIKAERGIKFKIMVVVAIAAAVANTIGFLANFLLYGMDIPTGFCAGCDFLAIIYLWLGLKAKRYELFGALLLAVLIVCEFPLLVFAYGPVMYPYMVMGFIVVLMLLEGKKRTRVCIALGVVDVAVIVLSTIYSNLFGEHEAAGLLGSAVITFLVSILTISACFIFSKQIYIDASIENDSVTGYYTRAGFMNRVRKAMDAEPNKDYYIAYFDIRSFKSVNSLYGMELGNTLLRQVSNIIASSLLKPSIIGRTSADHFVCFGEGRDFDLTKLEKICHFKFEQNGKVMALVLSCGIYYVNDKTMPIQSMCDRAQAVAKNLKHGTNKFIGVFDDRVREIFTEETHILGLAEQAVQDREFEPYYQPVIDAKTKKVVSAEALARWISKDKGIISPAVFIPILESKGLISDLDYMIFNKVDNFIDSRLRVNKYIVPISTNLSRVDFFDREVMIKISNVVGASKERANKHRFEITESVYEGLSQNIVDILGDLRQKGAEILVDDFGSGYSSLGTITDYKFDVIKIDMSLTKQIEKNERVKGVMLSIIDLAHNLQAKVVAEGVETENQYQFLRDSGCDYLQGYYFYKPMKEQDFAQILDAQNKE